MFRVAIAVVFWVISAVSAAERPNVLIIVGDDWGWPDFGFMGSKIIKTPALDRLAAEGTVFPNGYVPTSLCRASLATILTGQYAHQHKICCNDPPTGVDRAEMLPFLKNSPSFPRLLRDAGYKSFQTGKFWEGHHTNGGFTDGMTTKGRHGEEGLAIGRKTLDPIFEFLDRTGKNPWMIWYAPMMPHTPHDPPADILKLYTQPGRDLRLAKYYAMCDWTDRTIADLMARLNKKGLTKNLLTIFVVDNGWVQSEGMQKGNDWSATRSKNTPYDMGVRTPIIVHQPGVVKQQKIDEPISTIDISPTILEGTGTPIPAAITGKSLLPISLGKSTTLGRDGVFGEIYVHTALKLEDPAANLTHRWVRSGDWKLVQSLKKDGAEELFNLRSDPLEAKNRLADEPQTAERLRKLIADSWKSWPAKGK